MRSRAYEPDHAAGVCPTTMANARLSPVMCWIARLRLIGPTRSGGGVVIALLFRRVAGWSMSGALIMATWQRGKLDILLHHSDWGSQYTGEQFQRLMADKRRDGKLLLLAQDRADWEGRLL